MHRLSVLELSRGLAAGEYSSVELTRHFLDRIDSNNDRLNAFISVTPERAMAQAAKADERIKAGNAHALTGVPLAHKDIFCVDGEVTTCASKMLKSFVSPYDATVVERLQNVGTVMLGKTNMDEFAMGSSNENSCFGPALNPWDETRVPGGSSGGSAAAVAAGLTPVATGTDTGGSVRQPAALTGTTGIKPTYGRVSRYGMIAFASSLDQAGIIGQNAGDAALMLDAICGFDPRDSTSSQVPYEPLHDSLGSDLKGLRIGVPEVFFSEGLDEGVKTRVEEALNVYREHGAELLPVSLPHLHLSVPTYYVVAPAECSSNLSRFDGVRFGHRCDNPENLEDLYRRSRSEGFGPEVLRRILTGTFVLSAGYYDAYYKKAQQVRRLINADFQEAFKHVDLIMGPTSPTTAFPIGDKTDDPVNMYLNDIYTIAVSLAGLPAASIPCGLSDSLPVGLHIIGDHFCEQKVLAAAHQYQLRTDFHTQTPGGEGA
ncbi:MAG: Asp-tRNA(Asn)/Glu-tRNA(Gln) amidotransferase subunit GatA [Gammaproteobacteria bacterium]